MNSHIENSGAHLRKSCINIRYLKLEALVVNPSWILDFECIRIRPRYTPSQYFKLWSSAGIWGTEKTTQF